MKRKEGFFIGLLLVMRYSLVAQEFPVQQQYLVNKFLLNPAYAGYLKCDEFRISHRQQWVGFDRGPMTPVISYHGRVWQGLGVGAYVFGDRNGLTNQSGGQLAVAYHINLSHAREVTHQLSFGLAMNYTYRWVNTSAFTDNVLIPNAGMSDPNITGGGLLIPNFTTGVNYINRNFFAGISATNLMKNPVGLGELKNSTGAGEPYLPLSLFFNSGYYINLSPMWGIEPSATFKMDMNNRKQIDANMRIFYQSAFSKYVFFGVSLRSNINVPNLQTVMPMVGFKMDDLYFAFTYDVGLTSLQKYNYGSVGLMLGYNICRGKRIERAPCPAFRDKIIYK